MSDPAMSTQNAYRQAIREGTWLAAAAGFMSSAVCVAIILHDAFDTKATVVIGLSAVASATVFLAFFWRQLAPTRSDFSIGYAALAGLLSALLSHFTMWIGALYITLGLDLGPSDNMLSRAFGSYYVVMFFGAMSIVIAGYLTIPLAMLSSIGVTLWARRRIARSA